MDSRLKSKIIAELRRKIGKDLITQSELAIMAGVHQSHISRFLSGDFERVSPKLTAVCKALHIGLDVKVKKSVKNNKLLMSSLQRAWDGTDKHAFMLSKLLDTLATTNSYNVGRD